ncbi:MAG: MMPL family transporter [Acidimicrobiia bacterium]|jgi:RND superfamily putative drug exporter
MPGEPSHRPAEPIPSDAPGFLPHRFALWVSRHYRAVLAVWGVVLVASAAAYPVLQRELAPITYSVPGSDSEQVISLVGTHFSEVGSEQDVVAFSSAGTTVDDAAYADYINAVVTKVEGQPGVVSVLSPLDATAQGQVSADRHAAVAVIGLSGTPVQVANRASDLTKAIATVTPPQGVEGYLTGISPISNDLFEVEIADIDRAEAIGIPIAVIVLILALGTVVAGLLPLFSALGGLLLLYGVLTLLTPLAGFDSFLLSLVTMLSIGIGIDYALFIVSRFREELPAGTRRGDPAVAEAIATSLASSGRTVLFSGAIVMASLLSLFVVRSHSFQEMATGAVLTVICTLLAAWTLLPALLRLIGPATGRGALPGSLGAPPRRVDAMAHPGGWARWAHLVMARPLIALPGLVVLVIMALPMFHLTTGIDLGVASLANTDSGKAQAILSESFSPGAMAPIEILVSHPGSGPLDEQDLATVQQLTQTISADSRVASVVSLSSVFAGSGITTPAQVAGALSQASQIPDIGQLLNVANGSDRTLISVVPVDAVDSENVIHLVQDLRDTTVPQATSQAGSPQVLVGGMTAQFVDLSAEVRTKLPIVVAIVLTLSFLYLLVVFRSILLPAKAVLMNLLATGASFGLVTWVFQDGHGSGLLGFVSPGYIQVYLPVIVFAVLFGLSMDYEVFLVRRMGEEWERTHDNRHAVANGLAHTARPIAAAATIMAAVFGSFMIANVLELKQFGLALSAAVVLDATLIRLLIVPATMRIAGNANWWLPRWLDRLLPKFRLE